MHPIVYYGVSIDMVNQNVMRFAQIVKVSKLRRKEMKKFMKYNKENKIRLQKQYNQLGDNDKRMQRNKVFDLNILSPILSAENIVHAIDDVMEDNDAELYQDIARIDFCAMHGSQSTEDGFYRVLHSLSIVPP